ncbi:MAG: hypothetical protein FWG02_07570, partial [Holophagaceae bacterium]|nr:hypothetical protein [Holophagaceae bacterium]
RRVGCSDSLCKLSDFSSMSTCPCCENKIINKLSGAVRRYYCSNQTCEVSNINRLGNCPICKAKLIKQEKNSDVLTNIYCINTVCFGVLKSRLYHFASRNALNIEGFGEAIIDQFINTRQINNPWDIYKITENKADGLNFIISLEGMAEISANNLMDALINSKTKPFWQWIHALGIPNIGAVESQSLAKAFVNIHVLWKVGQCKYAIRSLEDIGEATEESLRTFINENNDLPIILDNWGILPSNEFTSLPYKFDLLKWIKKLSIAGLVETTLEKITSDYSTPEKLWILASNQSDFEIQRTKMGVDSKVAERLLRFCQTNLSLPEYMKLIRFADTSEYTQNLVLAGKTMVITGTLSKYSRAQSSKLLESLGAKIVGSVTKKTSCLLVGEAPGLNKIESAKKHGTQIVNELWLDDLLSQQQGVQ